MEDTGANHVQFARMTDDDAPPGDWAFYPCQVDDAPASSFLDLRDA